jgi:drug/metabolite transporter (DMT)-like permease
VLSAKTKSRLDAGHYFDSERGKDMQLWIGLVAVIIMAGGLGGILYLVIKQNAAIGTKTIQFLVVVFVLPLLIVLGIMNVLGRETIGTLLGVVVGYVLSGFGKE